MIAQVSLFVVLALICQVNAETTAAPGGNGTHHHHEQTETENFAFNYDGATHRLMVLQGTKCYIWTLTDAQQISVHTDAGLRSLEIWVLQQIDKALYTGVNKQILANSIIQACGKHAVTYYIVH